MVEEYKKLRQRDASSSSKSAWRITVRQLESLVRLSEAIARLHCADTVGASPSPLACKAYWFLCSTCRQNALRVEILQH